VTCLLLNQMALQLGQTELAESLARERARLQELVNGRLWNKELSYYQDVDRDGRFSPVKTLAAYWLLLDKESVGDRLADFLRPLRDEAAFRRLHPLPSFSADSPDYDPEQSGVWSPLNYVVLKGLRSVEQFALAHSLAVRHLQQVSEVYQHTDTFWDYYASETAAPGPDAQPDYIGWTGLTPIATLLEDVIGLYVDWPLRRVTWDRRLATTAPYGVRRFPLGPEGTADILGDDQQITVTTDVPFTLTVRDEELSLQTALPAGTTTLDLR
jgi:glycogen debranching enzyme